MNEYISFAENKLNGRLGKRFNFDTPKYITDGTGKKISAMSLLFLKTKQWQ